MTDNIIHNKSYSMAANSERNDIRSMPMDQDEIDLKELVLTIWDSKLFIAISTIIFGLIALVYAYKAPEVWTSSVKVMQPRINDYYQLSREVNKFQPVLSLQMTEGENNADTTKNNRTNQLTLLIQSDVLFKQYIDAFNSSINKKAFFKNNGIYQQFLADNGIDEINEQMIMSEWLSNIQAQPEDKRRGNPSYYTLAVSSYSQQSSFEILEQYTRYISDLVNKEVVQGLNNTIIAYKADLLTRDILLKQQAKQKLVLEKKKAEIAIDITSKASIDKPFLSYSNNEVFPISLGQDANIAKLKTLDKINDMSIFEPKLIEINAKLNILEQSSKINDDIKFVTISFIDEVSIPLSKDKPKRLIILLIGLFIGMVASVIFILSKKAFEEKY